MSGQRTRAVLAAACAVLALAVGVALMATAAWLISRAAEHPPVLYLMVAVVMVRAFALSRGLFRYGERLLGHDAALRGLTALRVRVFARLVPLAPGGLHAFRRGDLLSRFVADVDAQQDRLVRVLLPRVAATVVGGAATVFVAFLLPAAGVMLVAALVLAGIAGPWVSARVGARAESRLAPVRGELSADLVETLHGAPDLLAYGAVEARLAQVDARDVELTRVARRSAWSMGAGAAVSTLAIGAAVVGALLVAVPAVRAGGLDGVWLATLVLLPLALADVVVALPPAVAADERVRAARARVDAVCGRPEPVTEPDVPLPVPAGPVTLSLRGVGARWRPDGPLVLDGVDLDLVPGRLVAVVGRSGAGKSTLAALLVRFCEIADGAAELSGVDLRSLASDDVRSRVTWCAQDAHLFDTTMRQNLLLARGDASDGELRGALARARMLTWVESLPSGLDTAVGEHGLALSGGQRQRLALARALLAGAPVLVLDEPTANLDLPTADALTRDLLDATEGRTTLLVTHRLAELHRADEVLVLESGRVTQRGRHEDLLAVPGAYRELAERESAAGTSLAGQP